MPSPADSPNKGTRALVKLVEQATARMLAAQASRDRLLVDLAALGFSSRELAPLVGLSHTSVARIVRAGRGQS